MTSIKAPKYKPNLKEKLHAYFGLGLLFSSAILAIWTTAGALILFFIGFMWLLALGAAVSEKQKELKREAEQERKIIASEGTHVG